MKGKRWSHPLRVQGLEWYRIQACPLRGESTVYLQDAFYKQGPSGLGGGLGSPTHTASKSLRKSRIQPSDVCAMPCLSLPGLP